MQSPEVFFRAQLAIIRNAINENCLIMGDFNLDARMTDRTDYNYKIPLASLTDLAPTHNLTQIVTFNTWSRIIKGIRKESLLDHVYVNNFASVSNIDCCTPVFGDHVLVIVDLNISVQKLDKQIVKRDWSRYSALDLNIAMHMRFASSTVNWAVLDVNKHWNALEDIIINCIDTILRA